MNPDTNRLEELQFRKTLDEAWKLEQKRILEPPRLLRPNGEPVPEHWSIFKVDEIVVVNNYQFKIAHIGEKHLLLEPHGPVLINPEQK